MAINKNALIRYQTLDRCFRNPGRMYFIEDLLYECNHSLQEFNPDTQGVRKRQLFDDIRFMCSDQGWSIPLEKKRFGNRVYYRYSDKKFSINNQPLNSTEASQLKSALMILSRFSGTPQFEWVNEISLTLETKLGLIQTQKPVIAFDSNIDLTGQNWLPFLFNAITNQVVLEVTYQDFKSPNSYFVNFHPYYLKQYNNRWFVFGLNDNTEKSDWILALDRIKEVKETTRKYKPCSMDWEDYFYDIVGVSQTENSIVQEIILRVSSDQAPYIITKPLHPTQRTRILNGQLEVRIKVRPNYELESLLLSMGEKLEVVFPENLRQRIQDRLLEAAAIYNTQTD